MHLRSVDSDIILSMLFEFINGIFLLCFWIFYEFYERKAIINHLLDKRQN